MARTNREKHLISINDINEELFPIPEVIDEYITKSGKIYTWYHDDLYYPKKNFVNKANGYVYTNLRFLENGKIKIKNRRVHVILAKTFIPNPDPEHLKVVGHMDNNKQNNNLNNLYWTTNQDNTQKAVDDGINKNKKGIENENSQCVAVYNKNGTLMGVYGSITECSNCIQNVSTSAVARCIKTVYKPRTRKYLYKACSKEFYQTHPGYQGINLIENKNEKKMRQFIMKNEKEHIYLIMDNQKAASLICDIPQAMISEFLRKDRNESFRGWSFKVIKETTYKESSAYKNLINLFDGYLLKNIRTGELKEFATAKEVQDTYGLNGHDLGHYCRTGQTMLNEWKVFKIKRIENEQIAV